jgi:hypothetical protein
MHTYANLEEAMNFARDEGYSGLWGATSTNRGRALSGLEAASRRVEEWCGRSAYGSGFGPRTAVNRYDGTSTQDLDLRDDFLTISSISAKMSTAASTSVTPVVDTDCYLRNQRGGYEPAPYRKIILTQQGNLAVFGYGYRVTTVTGVAGYANVTRLTGATITEDLDTSETGVDVSAVTDAAPGTTILIDTEQMYVTGTSALTLTVVRGANGTTAAIHTSGAAVSRYVYDASVVEATARLWLKRWRSRDAGADGGDGGGTVGVTNPLESEDTILRRTVGHLKLNVQVAT